MNDGFHNEINNYCFLIIIKNIMEIFLLIFWKNLMKIKNLLKQNIIRIKQIILFIFRKLFIYLFFYKKLN